ncbi:MAG TPA: NAD(P)-binding domain-containing protein [Actinomycetes bacterium]
MRSTHTVVIGAGQAGLAVSHLLGRRGVDHVVLDRGRTGESWRSRRWDSLRLLTPNWMTRLPGAEYDGPDPAGFMAAAEVAGFLSNYARSSGAPVVEAAEVVAVRSLGDGYLVASTAGTWTARAVVIATGACQHTSVPQVAAGLHRSLVQVTPDVYRRPEELPDGGVLVVGASASGAQLADELASSGRDVVLAVGGHTRLPRRYRGLDSIWWLDQLGAFERHVDDLLDPAAALREPSLQLAGRSDGQDVDLPSLHDKGVRLAGRLVGARGSVVTLAADLAETTAAADHRLYRLLARIDGHIARSGLETEVLPRGRLRPVPRPADAPTRLDLRAERVRTVLWATGYKRSYPWLRVPVLDPRGELMHRHGITPAPGLYVVGLRWQTRRSSTFIDGVGHDARLVVDHLTRTRGGAAADVASSEEDRCAPRGT